MKLAAVAGAVAALLSGPAWAEDWPQWLGPNRDGVTVSEPPVEPWPADGPAVVWRAACGEGCASPVVVGDKVIVMDRAGDRERIRCLSAETGKELWSADYEETAKAGKKWGQGARCTPTIADGHVFALGIGGKLSCVELSGGKIVWQKQAVSASRHPDYGVYGSPLVVGDVVIVSRQGTPALVAFKRQTGEAAWQALSTGGYFSTPQIAELAGRRQVVVGIWKHMAGLDPTTGEVLWQHAHPKPIDAFAMPVIHRNVVMFYGYGVPTFAVEVTERAPGTAATQPGTSAFQTRDLWQNGQLRPWFNAAVAHQGRLYVCNQSSGETGGLACADMASGKLLWLHRIAGFGPHVAAWVLVIGDKLLVAVEDGRLILGRDEKENFKTLASAKVLDKEAYAMPAFAAGRLYVRNFGEVICLQLAGKSPPAD